jgi:hypothetical protein
MITEQLIFLFVLALPVACLSWTVAREEILREPRDWLVERSQDARHWWQRKFCYALTCEYCFSHYVAALFVALADYQLLLTGWRGYFIAWLALVSIANVYMSAYSRLRVQIHKEKAETQEAETRSRRAG